jgi:hypothetical protein
MVRQFKHHEQKLLKKVDFLNVRAAHLYVYLKMVPNSTCSLM